MLATLSRNRLNRQTVERQISEMWEASIRAGATGGEQEVENNLLRRLQQQEVLDIYAGTLYTHLNTLVLLVKDAQCPPELTVDAELLLKRISGDLNNKPLPAPALPELVDNAFKKANETGEVFMCVYSHGVDKHFAGNMEGKKISPVLTVCMQKYQTLYLIVKHALAMYI